MSAAYLKRDSGRDVWNPVVSSARPGTHVTSSASKEPVSDVTQAHQRTESPSGVGPISDQPIELPFTPGEVIGGKYEVEGLIGAGGMGYVVAAQHVELHEHVALKFLRKEALAHEELVMRFATEARAAVRIKSEYVARVFDVGTLPDGVPFIVMEHLVGKDLCQLLGEQGQLPARQAVEYVMQICEALAAAHSIGIVHRDIKPENLFLADRGQGMTIIKVLDFGISKVALTGSAFDRQRMARTQMPMGSPVYMSPEQIRASEEIDGRTDIWSLGCVLYELLTGVPAFDAPSLTQLSATILEKDPVPMQQLAPDVPADLEAIVLRCLQKKPSQRFRNVAELAIALYPFGPRRARISAERCAQLLAESTGGHLELELPSMPPPANNSMRTTTSPSVKPPTSTNNPTAKVVEERAEEENPFRAKRHRIWIGASLALAAIIGAYAGARNESGGSAEAPAVAKPVAAAPRITAAPPQGTTNAAVATAVGAGAVVPAAAPGTTEAPATPASAAPAPHAKAAAPAAASAAARRAAAVAHPKRETTRPAHGSDELDVGF